MFRKLLKYFFAKKWLVFPVVCLVGAGAYYLFATKGDATTTPAYAVVQTVEAGTVSSGIVTTGTIVATQKLSLDVYKQSRRIVAVNVKNAEHVNAGTVLYSFDKSGAYVDVQSSRVSIAEAELALSTARAIVSDPNTTIATLQNNLVTYRTDIVEAEKDLIKAQRDFYNANLEAESGNIATQNKHHPTISGVYNSTVEGTYTILVYGSNAKSGFSYRVTGLETATDSTLLNASSPIGAAGLKITFPTDIHAGDVWTVSVPHTTAAEYVKNKETYDTAVRTLNEKITNAKVQIANTETDIKQKTQSDATPYRSLAVNQAEAKVAAAKQQLSQNYDVVREQDIIAPFAGTVEGIENAVVGASPTGATNDSISLGTLISDDFLVQFTLNAIDVAKVTVGQKVIVNVTSFPGAKPLSAAITQISSLPESSGVAQYAVQAQIEQASSSNLVLREGLLADVEVVDQEVTDVLRIPLSAISYENGNASVLVVGEVTDEQKATLDTLGVIKSTGGTFPSYAVPVTVGVTGTFYVEIKTGLKVGDRIIVSKTDTASSVVQQNGFGPGSRRSSSATSSSGGSNDAAPE